MGATAAVPSGPMLWGGARAGATIDQVAAAIPQVKPLTGQWLEDGSQAGLSAPAQLAGSAAQAVFFFRAKGLSAVMVESHPLVAGHGAENLAQARRIIDMAKSQYGPPKSCVERVELAAVNCVWTTDQIRIALGYHDVGGGSPSLSVLYRAAR